MLAGLFTVCSQGNAITINRSYELNGGPLPNNFVTAMVVDPDLQGRITLRTLSVENPVSYNSSRFLFDQELYFSGFSDIGLPRDLSVPIPLNIAPVQMRVVMGGETSFPNPLTYSRSLTGAITSNAEIFRLKAADVGTVDTRAIGLHMQIYNWAGVDYTDINIGQTSVSFQAKMTDYQIFRDPVANLLSIEAGDLAYNAIAFTNTGTIASADTSLTNRLGAVLTNEGLIYQTTRGALIGNEGELINRPGARITSNIVNSGTITNFGDFQLAPAGTSVLHLSINDTKGVILGLAGTLSTEAAGRFFNHGLISLATGASFVGKGGLQSDGTITLDGGSFDGGLSNSGTVTVANGGTLTTDSLSNSGQLTVSAGTMRVNAGGLLDNGNGGVLQVDAGGLLQIHGGFDNAANGLVQVAGSFELLGSDAWSNLGSAQFDHGSRLVVGAQAQLDSLGFLTLSGVVENSGELAARGGFVSMQSKAEVGNNGQFELGGDVTATLTGAFLNLGTLKILGTATFTNEGNLVSTGMLRLESTQAVGLSNVGTLEVQEQGALFIGPGATLANLVGAQLSLLGGGADNRGTLLNEGRLDIGAGGLSSRGSFVNTGNVISAGNITNAGSMVNEGSLLSSAPVFNLFRASFEGGAGSLTQVAGFDNLGTVVVAGSAHLLVEGDYTQDQGRTVVDGTLTADNILIQGGSLEGGAGHVIGNVRVGKPPDPPGHAAADGEPADGGTLDASLIIEGNLVVDGGTLSFDIRGLGDAEHDILTVLGSITFFSGTLALNFLDGFLPNTHDLFHLVSPGDRFGLNNATFTVAGSPDGYAFTWNEDGSLRVNAVPAPVPEPAAWLLALTGLAALAGARHWPFRRPAFLR